ncbi:MAG TPA: hypothetical protein VFR24_04565 [Candidatus Angelobacter sp.]|nr:hypothetical protein [Candidatus Angelobacter sp.]
MRTGKGRVSDAAKQRIPRISRTKAGEVLAHCDQTLNDSRDVLANLSRVGFPQLLAVLSDDILRLAVQPDAWGERVRARLLTDIAPALQGDLDGKLGVSVEDVSHCASIVMPCLLLELGRRFGHIEIEFPSDPTNSVARFKFRAGSGRPVHSIDNQQLLFISSRYGPNLVGLCYFGDEESRVLIERAFENPQNVAAMYPDTTRYKQ